ncbi:hypothetical protein N7468_007159 [Penicillium chermesinum]|uniref:Uncharacterized protein n=1 Tax=Penicillium chermesinum TaxID=63820 RepID=A0A9W9TKI0_9EURO|nr:uncharacterized protein N7468_007159 [Penicillium chermesinum]KAJ5225934.1 hypothetical protein N7468_007159 [Penicillium chermesinum]
MFHPAPFFTSTSESVPPASLTKKKATGGVPAKESKLVQDRHQTSAHETDPSLPQTPQRLTAAVYPITPITPLRDPSSPGQSLKGLAYEAPVTPDSSFESETLDSDYSDLNTLNTDSASLISELYEILDNRKSYGSPSSHLTPVPSPRHSKPHNTRGFTSEGSDCFSSRRLHDNLASPSAINPARSYEQLLEDHLLEINRQSKPHVGQDISDSSIPKPAGLVRKRGLSDLHSPPAHHLKTSASQSALETQPGPQKPVPHKLKSRLARIFRENPPTET